MGGLNRSVGACVVVDRSVVTDQVAIFGRQCHHTVVLSHMGMQGDVEADQRAGKAGEVWLQQVRAHNEAVNIWAALGLKELSDDPPNGATSGDHVCVTATLTLIATLTVTVIL